MYLFTFIGSWATKALNSLGNFTLFLLKALKTLLSTRLKIHQLATQMKRIGVDSFTIILLTGVSTGFALALQTYIGLMRFGSEEVLGVVVALGMVRELGPVLTALMVTARCGSAMAAELGTMKITEQIDGLRTLRINPYQYLIVPRILAGIIILPLLTIFSMLFGILGGYIYTTYFLELNPESYISNIQQFIVVKDIAGGLIKAAFFGFIISSVGSFAGYQTKGGAEGIGKSTTQAVVVGSILILIANYILSSILYSVGI